MRKRREIKRVFNDQERKKKKFKEEKLWGWGYVVC